MKHTDFPEWGELLPAGDETTGARHAVTFARDLRLLYDCLVLHKKYILNYYYDVELKKNDYFSYLGIIFY